MPLFILKKYLLKKTLFFLALKKRIDIQRIVKNAQRVLMI